MAFFRVVPVVVTLSIGILLLGIGIAIFPIFNSVLHTELAKMIPMSANSDTLSTWEDPRDSVDMFMKFYFFHITNPDDVVKNGSKPNLVQIGPYVYNEIKVKKNVTFDTENSTVTYVQPRSWSFNRSMSVGSENDSFVTLNVPVYAIMDLLANSAIGEIILNEYVKYARNATMFRTLTVKDLLWGYKDDLLTLLSAVSHLFHMKLPMNVDGNFGFFYQKNGTDDGIYTVNTGQQNLNEFMDVEEWNHDRYVHYWKTENCNKITGTDGTMYHPFLDKAEKLYLFSSDLCRSIHVDYDSTVFLEDVPLYHYLPPASMFKYQSVENQCYCVGKHCPHDGSLNISQCQQGAPVFVSQPHFLNGDYYLQQVTGLSPNASIHNTFIDVEPNTGVVMRGAKRLQMNIALQNISLINEANKLPTLLYPLLWLEEAAEINAKGMATFKNQFFSTEQWIYFTAYVLIAVGGAIVLFVLIYIANKAYHAHKNKKVITSQGTSDPNERTPLLNDKKPPVDDDNDWSDMLGNETYTD